MGRNRTAHPSEPQPDAPPFELPLPYNVSPQRFELRLTHPKCVVLPVRRQGNLLVGLAGLEPTTECSQSTHSTT